ncbi:class I SAM-dependent methyltransferase [Nocardioides marmoriginsengisoli]|uniref:Class I SAM-dependent methyltransferase n=1 Tax=Nocardioides marmoriginsengisoli TaxID=661483 RepID=A0A3N0CRL3_9ACTN|nr:class I SAM-dependent methyltransferase [Nocardioides marmoriginsengisoli]RNL66085.1 class I SAM-dependent methyltransferase [Nocardioides marmoriginsengisoli]
MPSPTTDSPSIRSCPACLSDDVVLYPPSRKTGRRVLGCRVCGLRAWAERSTYSHDMEDPAGALTFDYEGYVQAKREGAMEDAWDDALAMLAELLAGRPDLNLFDVGAGDGKFLDLARKNGFGVGGNELHAGAVELAKSRYDVDLLLGELPELALENAYDALTMWCVLAHVEDVDSLVDDCFKLLKPGGLMYLQTPRWTVVDRMALAALKGSSGRFTRIVDRRVAEHHWQLHTTRSMVALLERHGFRDVKAIPKARYSLKSSMYLNSLGMPAGIARPTGFAMDTAIKHGPVPRIVLDVFARKPE